MLKIIKIFTKINFLSQKKIIMDLFDNKNYFLKVLKNNLKLFF